MLDAIPTPALVALIGLIGLALAVYAPGALAIAALGFFVAIMAWHVPEPDLVICLVVVVLMAAFDFGREWVQHRNGTGSGDGSGNGNGEGGE